MCACVCVCVSSPNLSNRLLGQAFVHGHSRVPRLALHAERAQEGVDAAADSRRREHRGAEQRRADPADGQSVIRNEINRVLGIKKSYGMEITINTKSCLLVFTLLNTILMEKHLIKKWYC